MLAEVKNSNSRKVCSFLPYTGRPLVTLLVSWRNSFIATSLIAFYSLLDIDLFLIINKLVMLIILLN